jgi:hypothetical protein
MRGLAIVLLFVSGATGCYAGARATRDVNAAWRGRSRAQLEARWHRPAIVTDDGKLVWTHTRQHVELPGGSAALHVGPGEFDARAELRPGVVWNTTTEVVATVDAASTVVSVEGPSLRYGPPRGLNMRWGTLLGAHVGMGRLDDTATPLPSGGAYLGGMLSPTLGLVGTFSLVAGSDDAGGAMGLAGGVAAQWWPLARLWLRAGPALILSFDPGFDNAALTVGATTGVSYAVLRLRVFVLDLRLDVTGAPGVVFGSAGVGVAIN